MAAPLLKMEPGGKASLQTATVRRRAESGKQRSAGHLHDPSRYVKQNAQAEGSPFGMGPGGPRAAPAPLTSGTMDRGDN